MKFGCIRKSPLLNPGNQNPEHQSCDEVDCRYVARLRSADKLSQFVLDLGVMHTCQEDDPLHSSSTWECKEVVR